MLPDAGSAIKDAVESDLRQHCKTVEAQRDVLEKQVQEMASREAEAKAAQARFTEELALERDQSKRLEEKYLVLEQSYNKLRGQVSQLLEAFAQAGNTDRSAEEDLQVLSNRSVVAERRVEELQSRRYTEAPRVVTVEALDGGPKLESIALSPKGVIASSSKGNSPLRFKSAEAILTSEGAGPAISYEQLKVCEGPGPVSLGMWMKQTGRG